jgi:general stress protein 26
MTHKGVDSRESDIQRILDANRFAVLATQRGGQPHTSLVAFTPVDGIRQLVFATYRSTRKFESLLESHQVALFIGGQVSKPHEACGRTLLTAHGTASVVPPDEKAHMSHQHKMRHPDLDALLSSPESALITVDVTAYQLVNDIEDVHWFEVTDEAA